MRKDTQIQTGYFDATILLQQVKGNKSLKVTQYLDNDYVKQLLIAANKSPITTRGWTGFTQLPLELYEDYMKWIETIKESNNDLY